MSAFVPQQPNVPVSGSYRNPTNPRLFGTTAEDIRRVKKQAAEEDYSQFLTADQQYMDYKKTNVETVYFENLQRNNPDVMRLKLPKSTYPLRVDNAYFLFQFNVEITIPNNSSQGAEMITLNSVWPTQFRFWKIIESFEISVGSNGCVITNSEQDYHYQNRIMSLITKPVSKSNLINEYSMADMNFDNLVVDGYAPGQLDVHPNKRTQLWYMLGIDPSKVVQKPDADVTIKFPLTFQIPLTMLHPLYNFNSIIPPGMDVNFTFNLRNFSLLNQTLFRLTGDAITQRVKVRVRVAATRCLLNIEQPRRYPEILRSLKTKAYYNDILMEKFQKIDIEIPANVTYKDKIPLILPGGEVPVRIDWMLVPETIRRLYPFYFADASSAILKSVKFLIHFPFPYERTIEIKSNDDELSSFFPFATSQPYYHSEDNFQYATYGNQHVQHGAFPQIGHHLPLSEYLNYAHLMDPQARRAHEASELNKKAIMPHSVLLLPSDQLNQNPYPRVKGDVYMSFELFAPLQTKQTMSLHLNYYYWYRIHQENGKCSMFPIDDLGVKIDTADRP